MHHTSVTKLGKMIGSEDKVDLKALVKVVRNSCNLQNSNPEMSDDRRWWYLQKHTLVEAPFTFWFGEILS